MGDVEVGLADRPPDESRSRRRLGSRTGIDRHRKDPPLSMARLMREDVLLRPALEIKQNAMRQEFEASPGQPVAALSGKHGVESGAQSVKVEHVRGGVAKLFLAQVGRPPIRALLLFRKIDIQKVLAQIA